MVPGVQCAVHQGTDTKQLRDLWSRETNEKKTQGQTPSQLPSAQMQLHPSVSDVNQLKLSEQ